MRTRILDAAERLVIENGYAATSVDEVLAASGASKGAFFHHYPTKLDLARALVDRYAAADVSHLHQALAAVSTEDDPAGRLLAFLRYFEDDADALMAAQSSCLYVSVLTEQQLVLDGTADRIEEAVRVWRDEVAAIARPAFEAAGATLDAGAYADHLFVTFEGAFLLCRATGDAGHMHRQLTTLRELTAGLLGR